MRSASHSRGSAGSSNGEGSVGGARPTMERSPVPSMRISVRGVAAGRRTRWSVWTPCCCRSATTESAIGSSPSGPTRWTRWPALASPQARFAALPPVRHPCSVPPMCPPGCGSAGTCRMRSTATVPKTYTSAMDVASPQDGQPGGDVVEVLLGRETHHGAPGQLLPYPVRSGQSAEQAADEGGDSVGVPAEGDRELDRLAQRERAADAVQGGEQRLVGIHTDAVGRRPPGARGNSMYAADD